VAEIVWIPANASGVLIWNITAATATDHTQTVGADPYAVVPGSLSEGLKIYNTAGNTRLFAALGSSINLPDADGGTAGKQVATLHIAANDGIFTWANAIVGENGVQYTGIGGSKSSLKLADMNGDGAVNGLDVTPFVQVLTDLPAYQLAFPGLDGVGRGNINGDADANGLDVTPFVGCVTGGGCPGAGGGSALVGGSTVVPEPASAVLMAFGALVIAMVRRVRK